MPPTWNDGMLESWNNGQKRITSLFGSRLFRSMICLSHEPYYFSTRWNTNVPIIPLFHHSNCERSELRAPILELLQISGNDGSHGIQQAEFDFLAKLAGQILPDNSTDKLCNSRIAGHNSVSSYGDRNFSVRTLPAVW